MSSPREAPAWKQALLDRKRAKLAAGMELQRVPGPAPRPAPSKSPDGREAGAVVAESLGPLRENPFMRLEGERRRRRRRGAWELSGAAAAASPPSPPADPPALSQLLDLYRSMPGIRTIRADNILIIESSDAAAPTGPPGQGGGGGDAGDAPGRARGAPRGGAPLRDLLARGCCPVTEIRAAQVVVYEPGALTAAAGPDSGRVSRLLQKFDRAAKGAGRGGAAPAPPPPPRARPAPATLAGGSNFMQKIGSNSFMVNPRGRRPGIAAASALSNGPVKPEDAPPQSPSRSPGQQGAAAVSEAVPSSRTPAASSPPEAGSGKPKPEEPVETLPQLVPPSSASPDSGASAGPPQPVPPVSSSCSFEIRPAPKPDLTTIPAHDLQACALASLRLNSRNSFLFVPCPKEGPPGPPEPVEVISSLPGEALLVTPEKPAEPLVPVTCIDEDLVAPVPAFMPPLKVLSPRLEGFDVPQDGTLALEMEDSALPTYGPLSTGSVTLSREGTSTFTIVPKRKPPAAGLESFSRVWLQEEEEEDKSQTEAKTGALRQDLGHVKKRYPTVNEIEVIGGYLSLDKSCMSKSGFRRKKMKISFNETSLQTMFEYPSESSLVEEEEEEEDEDEYATEVDEKLTFFIPRPNSTMNSHTINSGFSSYTPKHSIDLSKWQEQQHGKLPPSIRTLPQETDLPNQAVMLTPAEKSHLSDFSSEPALYF